MVFEYISPVLTPEPRETLLDVFDATQRAQLIHCYLSLFVHLLTSLIFHL